MLQADPSKVSMRAKKRGLPQVSVERSLCNRMANLLLYIRTISGIKVHSVSVLYITSSTTDRFSNFFCCHTLHEICNKAMN